MIIKTLQNKNFLYKVIEGESLLDIANKFKVNEAKIIKDNNLLSKSIEFGDVLYIESENNLIYIVKPLDTLKKIAKKYNISESFIKEKNKLTNEHIFVGQLLIL